MANPKGSEILHEVLWSDSLTLVQYVEKLVDEGKKREDPQMRILYKIYGKKRILDLVADYLIKTGRMNAEGRRYQPGGSEEKGSENSAENGDSILPGLQKLEDL